MSGVIVKFVRDFAYRIPVKKHPSSFSVLWRSKSTIRAVLMRLHLSLSRPLIHLGLSLRANCMICVYRLSLLNIIDHLRDSLILLRKRSSGRTGAQEAARNFDAAHIIAVEHPASNYAVLKQLQLSKRRPH